MATVTFYQPNNMLSPYIWYGNVTSYDASHITLASGPLVATYYGSFTYAANDLSGGIVTGYDQWINGVADYSVRGGYADALTVRYYLDTYNMPALQQYVLQYDDTFYGSDGSDAIVGYTGSDVLYGNGGDDYVQGNQGNDWVYGNTGNDIVAGGQDIDHVYGGMGSDEVRGGMGNDVLGGGKDNDVLSGGQGDDVLTGGAGYDVLQGLLGVDTLTGGLDGDAFILNRAGAQNADIVTDFTHDVDVIAIDSSVFAALAGSAGGDLAAQNFLAGPNVAAQSAEQFLLYDTATGGLFYDADGSGPGAAVLMAVLTNYSVLDAGDIYVG